MRGKKKKSEKVEVCGRMKQTKNKGMSSSSSISNGGSGSSSTSSNGGGSGGFYGCYLLTSLSPRYKGHTYIGYTVNPMRRIRQHNGEICSGASTTKKKRPWEMVLCIHGFPSSTSALQFEWAWQHPRESVAVREAAVAFKTMGGVANKIKLALAMLTLPSWLPLDLTVSFFSTKYMIHTAGAPPRLKIHFCSIHELPCYSLYHHYTPNDDDDDDDDDDIPPQPLDYHLHVGDDIHPQPHCYHLDVDDDCNDEIPPQPHYHNLDVDDDIHPCSPPSHHFSTESEETTFNHHSQLTLNTHITQLSTPSIDEQVTQDFSLEDDMICVVMDDNIKEKTQHTHHHSPSTLSHTCRIPPANDTQIIDLLTPSPDNRIIGGTKKQRPPSDSPHIIDLTRSPLFVQL